MQLLNQRQLLARNRASRFKVSMLAPGDRDQEEGSRKWAPCVEIGPPFTMAAPASPALILLSPFHFPSFCSCIVYFYKKKIFFWPRIFDVAFIFPSDYYISMAPATPSVESKKIKACRQKISASEKVRNAHKNGFDDNIACVNNLVVHQPLNL